MVRQTKTEKHIYLFAISYRSLAVYAHLTHFDINGFRWAINYRPSRTAPIPTPVLYRVGPRYSPVARINPEFPRRHGPPDPAGRRYLKNNSCRLHCVARRAHAEGNDVDQPATATCSDRRHGRDEHEDHPRDRRRRARSAPFPRQCEISAARRRTMRLFAPRWSATTGRSMASR
jgi:hypothetical protein